ncbi:MAG TPA: response regulator [Gaiellaceae bacterium]|nr:response regulator [Gaiellaceae bacterium]
MNGTALVVDDDPSCRLVTRAMLERDGYRVLTAADGAEALALAADEPEIGVVVTDSVLTDTGGRELASRLRRVLPRAAIVLTSGDHDPRGTRDFLAKPFEARHLHALIESALRR